MKNILCCIPARYKSTRLQGKLLYKINNKSIIQLTYESVLKSKVTDIIVLTDDIKIYNEVINFGGNCVMTPVDCLNGTERIVKYLNTIDNSNYDYILNAQGDEPYIDPENINKLLFNSNLLKKEEKLKCLTLCSKTKNMDDIKCSSRGKVVLDNNNFILYVSRNIIPVTKKAEINKNIEYNIHIGVFLFDKEYLINEYCKENTYLQKIEDIEWLKILEQGYDIQVQMCKSHEIGIDTIEDYNYLKNKYSK
tara:strand:- start:84 stop:833 length:750 start_codon:yes stop_codon:yes gene_type:complete